MLRGVGAAAQTGARSGDAPFVFRLYANTGVTSSNDGLSQVLLLKSPTSREFRSGCAHHVSTTELGVTADFMNPISYESRGSSPTFNFYLLQYC